MQMHAVALALKELPQVSRINTPHYRMYNELPVAFELTNFNAILNPIDLSIDIRHVGFQNRGDMSWQCGTERELLYKW